MALHEPRIWVGDVLLQFSVEFIGFGSALIEYPVKIVETRGMPGGGQPRTQPAAFSGRQAKPMMRRDLGAPRIRVHSRGIAVHDIIVDAVLEVVARRVDPVQTPYIRLVLTE